MVSKIMSNKKTYILITVFILVLAIIIPLGFSEGTDSSTTFFNNTTSSAGGLYLNEAIDQMNYYCSRKCPSNKTCKSNTPKCKRATTLHTETCSQTSSYCAGSGYSNGATITYGNSSTTSGVLTVGDAFDCDVNGDGTYNSTNERFYYVSDYYDTSTMKFNDKLAVLIYYSDVKAGVASTQGVAYDCNLKYIDGPLTARSELPTTSQWSNIYLYKETRPIITQANTTSTDKGSLTTSFNYGGYAARFLTYQEVYNGCYDYNNLLTVAGSLDAKCQFLMERTKFSNNSFENKGPWLETPYSTSGIYAATAQSTNRNIVYNNLNLTTYGVRPTIEVLKSDISY